MFRSSLLHILFGLVIFSLLSPLLTQAGANEFADHSEPQETHDEKAETIVKKTENPISENIAVSFLNNISFGVGPGEVTRYELRIKMLNFTKHRSWWLLHRPVIPVTYIPETIPGGGAQAGLGDFNYRLYITHRDKDFFWGIGPAFFFPTATSSQLGTGKWSAGPTIAVAAPRGKLLLGVVVLNIWSFAGDPDRPPVNAFTAQPFISYRLGKGWFLESSPEIIANWKAERDNRWIVPVGAGLGRVLRINNKPIVIRAAGFYFVEHPTSTTEWEIRIGFDFVFKKLLWNPY